MTWAALKNSFVLAKMLPYAQLEWFEPVASKLMPGRAVSAMARQFLGLQTVVFWIR